MIDKEERYVSLIKKVAQTMDECGLASVHVSENSGANHISFSLQKSGEYGGAYYPAPAANYVAGSFVPQPAAEQEAPQAATPAAASDAEEVKSPMVGVFYAAPSPEADPFVRIGDTVKKGDVLCILEAMKLMNEITAEQDGKIADICAKNGDVVEFGQVLFKISDVN